jgi:uncharacterized protein YggE
MKTLILALVLALPSAASAQTAPAPTSFPRTITVNGSAEMSVTPDEIYVSITLKEYTRKGEKKDLKSLTADFLAACKAAGIPDSAISVFDLDGYNERWYWARQSKRPEEIQGQIAYELKVARFDMVEALAEKLDDYGSSFHVTRTAHSNASAFRKQLKIDAMKAAKEKARYLSESIGENIGPAITITEPSETGEQSQYTISQTVSNSLSSNTVENMQPLPRSIAARKLRYRYEVVVVFALK